MMSAVGFCLFASLSSVSLAQTVNPASSKAILTAATPENISLEWTLQQALLKNNRLQLFSFEQRITEALEIQANLSPNPTLEVTVENIFGSGQVSGINRAQTTFALSQVIEMAGKRQRRIELVHAKQRQQLSEYELQRMEVLSETTARYYRVLHLQAIKRWLDEKLNIELTALNNIKQRAQAGNVTQADVSRVLLRVTKTRRDLQSTISGLNIKKQELAMMWSEQAKFEVVEGRLSLNTPLPKTEKVLNAIESSPEFMQLLNVEQILKAKTRAEIAKGEVDISVGLGVRRYEEFDDSAFMLTFSMPLALTNSNQGNILAAKQRENKLLQQQKLARSQIRLTLLAIQQRLKTTHELLQSLSRNNLPLAQQLMQETAQAYNAGKVNVLQLLDAQNELFEVQLELINNKFEVVMQLLELERITGQSMTQHTTNSNNSNHASNFTSKTIQEQN